MLNISTNFISFDIFDTLLKRDVKDPKDVFRLMLEKIKYESICYIPDTFVEDRVFAEKTARKISNCEEIIFDDIYNCFDDRYDLEMIKILKNIELQIEKQILTKNIEIFDLYKKCLEQNKYLVIASDMYLPKEFILEILNNNGIFGFQKLYLSSDIKKTKRSGNLFKYILSDLKISPNQLFHIGDNKISDFEIPCSFGITSHLIKTFKNNTYFYSNSTLEKNYLNTFINNRISKKDLFYDLGYECFGILLFNFCIWLNNNVKKNEISKILFFSRDGYIIKKAYDILFPNSNNTYFYASRRGLIVPTLFKINDFFELKDFMHLKKTISLHNFIKSVGLEDVDLTKYKIKHNINDDFIVDTNHPADNFLLFFNDIKKEIISNSKKEFDIISKYIKDNLQDKKIAIVDIGWHGNMQKAIFNILKLIDIKCELYGFYVGVRDSNSKQSHNNHMKGFLFDDRKENKKFNLASTSIFESVFLANHGSVKKFNINSITFKIEPIFYKYEYLNENNEYIDDYYKIQKFQNGALKFVIDFKKSNIKFLQFDTFYSFNQLLNKPTLEIAEKFGNLKFFDVDESFIAKPKGRLYYFFHPNVFISDLKNSSWRIGFLKRVFVVNVRYDLIISFVKRLIK
ncbi:MAG: hypothetical protein MR902_08695 [Campylobacter sp.]|nr:hypothetical protein [Campylobacter sp.]